MNNYSNEDLTLDKKITDIKVVMKGTKNIRMYKRYLVILKHLQGNTNRAIAKMVSLEQHTVGDYIRNYKANGLTGLDMKHSTGDPRKLSKEEEIFLFETITNRTPEEVGFESRKNWTIEIARQWIKNTFAISISHRGTHEVLHRLNLSYTRPTYVLKKADKEKQEEFKVTFEGLKKLINGEIDHILFQDESMIRDYQAIQKSWFMKGQQRKISTYGKNAGVKLIGILDYETGKVYCEEHDKYDAVVFERFLKDILKQYPAGKTIMVLDNARIHHVKLLQPLLRENRDRLELVFLPPYSPELNLIEGLWGWLKSNVINNSFYLILSKVRVAVQNFINHINKVPTQIIDRLCIKM